MPRLCNIYRNFVRYGKSPFFGFTCGHYYLTDSQKNSLKALVNQEDCSVVGEFEFAFSKLLGGGSAVSYASGRMAFYELLKVYEVGPGDEVILLGFTCAVMANAVLRTGATPVYSDLDVETFGSCLETIEPICTSNTRVIVVQHTFGIPCKVEQIIEFARGKGIIVIEDCALTLGSSISGKLVGCFGDAAIFSTDHTKPINTLVGGLAYTKNLRVANLLRERRDNCSDLSHGHKMAIYDQILIEKQYCNPSHESKLGLYKLFSATVKKFSSKRRSAFLDSDFGTSFTARYPYPARMPSFLCLLGLLEIEKWKEISRSRIELLDAIIQSMPNEYISYLPKAYFDDRLVVVPLRFAFYCPDYTEREGFLSEFIDVNSIWFRQPVLGAQPAMSELKYSTGNCPISEKIGSGIVNFPCNFDPSFSGEFLKNIHRLADSNL